MRYLLIGLLSLSTTLWAQDYSGYLAQFDNRIYSLKSKNVKDFVVDVESSRLTKKVNDQTIFGKISKLSFRFYWTASPERLEIEVRGLPDGFREIKEDLKANILVVMEDLIPLVLSQKFTGYKINSGSRPKEIVMQDSSGVADIPIYILKFDSQDKLLEVEGKKPVGSLIVSPIYEKESFADGKWVLTSMTMVNSDGFQTTTIKKELEYGNVQGIGVLEKIEIDTVIKREGSDAKPLISREEIELSNYKINTGEGLNYFLSEGSKPSDTAVP